MGLRANQLTTWNIRKTCLIAKVMWPVEEGVRAAFNSQTWPMQMARRVTNLEKRKQSLCTCIHGFWNSCNLYNCFLVVIP